MQDALSERIRAVVLRAAPDLGQERQDLWVRYGVWTVALDDRLDAAHPDLTDLHRLRDNVAAVIRGDVVPAGPLTGELAAILHRLSSFDSPGKASTRMVAALEDAVAAGIEHAELGLAVFRGSQRQPTAKEYLSVAAHTVNYRSFAWMLPALRGAELAQASQEQIETALTFGAKAVRLGNDLRSVERDRAERTLNILALRNVDGTAVTPGEVRDQIQRHVRDHHEALREAAEAGSLRRLLELAVGLYKSADLR